MGSWMGRLRINVLGAILVSRIAPFNKKGMINLKRIPIILILIVLILGIMCFFIIRNGEARYEPVVVDTMIAEHRKISSTVITDGLVVAEKEREIIAGTNGFIKLLNIVEGDVLEQNEIIVVIENHSLDKDIKEAILKLKEAEKEYQDLLDRFSKQDDIYEYNINILKQELEEAEKAMDIMVNSLNMEKINLEERLQITKNKINELKKELENKYILYQKNSITQKEYETIENAYKNTEIECTFVEKRIELLEKHIIPDTLKQHTIELEKFRNNYNLKKLSLERQMLTEIDLEIAQNRVNYYKSYLNMLENEAENLTVVAPISGIINEISVEQGNYVNKGNIIGKMISLDNVVEAWIDEADINKVKVGQKVYISGDSFAGKIEGEVTSLLPYAVRHNNLSRFKSTIKFSNNELLKTGTFVNLEILTDAKESAIVIPSIAVLGDSQKYVFVKKNGRAYMKRVEMGISNPFEVEVIGIEPGEEVIIGPYSVLKTLDNGVPVIGRN